MTLNATIDLASRVDLIWAPLLTSGIIGTTLSITIYSQLSKTEYRLNTYAVLIGAAFFAFSSFCILCYINYIEDMRFLFASRLLLQTGLLFIISSFYTLYKMVQVTAFARETEQFPDLDPRLTPEHVVMQSP